MIRRAIQRGQRRHGLDDHGSMSRKRRRRSCLKLAAGCALEPLESRRLLTTMIVTGTVGPDTITLSVSGGFLTATVNGTPTVGADATITAVSINAREGNDTILIHSNGSNPVTRTCGAMAATPAARPRGGAARAPGSPRDSPAPTARQACPRGAP